MSAWRGGSGPWPEGWSSDSPDPIGAVRSFDRGWKLAAIKLTYIGGGSTRAPGTMAAFVQRAARFAGSEITLVDLDEEHLGIVRRLAMSMARAEGADIRVRTTLNRRDGLRDADVVLTSFRPGGFEARYLDESIPLRYGVIGQETQGPGGFFMALRTITVMREILADMDQLCPNAILINYTNPVNIVSEAVTHHSGIPTISLCEGPLVFPAVLARSAGLDPDRLDATYAGLNHTGWTLRHVYDGKDVMPLIQEAADRRAAERSGSDEAARDARLLHLAATMGALPAAYLDYFYYHSHAIEQARAKPSTRAQDLLAEVGSYWQHYRDQADSARPQLDPARSRSGVNELQLAVDVIDAIVNDTGGEWPVNVPNAGGVLPGFPEDLVVEVPAIVDRQGAHPIAVPPFPRHLRGLIEMLAEFQALTAEAAWSGNRLDAVRALSAHPLVSDLPTAEAMYADMAAAHRAYLPERLVES